MRQQLGCARGLDLGLGKQQGQGQRQGHSRAEKEKGGGPPPAAGMCCGGQRPVPKQHNNQYLKNSDVLASFASEVRKYNAGKLGNCIRHPIVCEYVIAVVLLPATNDLMLLWCWLWWCAGVKGIVLEAFGVGNFPDLPQQGWVPWLRQQTRKGLQVSMRGRGESPGWTSSSCS